MMSTERKLEMLTPKSLIMLCKDSEVPERMVKLCVLSKQTVPRMMTGSQEGPYNMKPLVVLMKVLCRPGQGYLRLDQTAHCLATSGCHTCPAQGVSPCKAVLATSKGSRGCRPLFKPRRHKVFQWYAVGACLFTEALPAQELLRPCLREKPS